MEWPVQSPDHNPIENLWGEIKHAVSEEKNKICRGIVVSSWAGIPVQSCHTPCNTDVKQFSETGALQLNVNSVIHKNAKSSRLFSVYTVNV